MKNTLAPSIIILALLRPLARYCIARGIRIQELEQEVKRAFVEAGQEAIKEVQGEVSVSKISVMTGIHRVEIGRLLSGEPRTGEKHDVLNRIIGLWSNNPKYLNSSGMPRPLTFQGHGSEFADLVASISKEVSPYPILFELERIGAIRYNEEIVELQVQEYTPQGDIEHGAKILSDDLNDLLHAVEVNLTGQDEIPSLHLRTSYDNINPAALETIRRWVLERGTAFQRDIRNYLSAFDRDINPEAPKSDERAKVTVSSFSVSSVIEPPKIVKPKKRGRKPCVPRS